ncbi:hypothetical protein Tsubulata_008264 [Turnera subulata]|uniref:SBP-type domain-containing protein n=1 Tax=Turnera subulata TaxID=218843 RepID=A0A9Q0FA01_9ROSI|nr:hypothetical protein Tsubulata_008264 [Turnera subulata]
MENGANNVFSSGSHSNRSQQISGNHANLGWDTLELNSTSRLDWAASSSNTNNSNNNTTSSTFNPTPPLDNASPHAPFFPYHHHHHGRWLHHHQHHSCYQHHSLYDGDGSHLHPDPHLMCLKLGKRHYFEDPNGNNASHVPASDQEVPHGVVAIGKKGKPYFGKVVGHAADPLGSSVAAPAALVPRCQVEGCHVALVNAKDYHRRHKVCEMHSKAPRVIVLGLEQRFCQQCSRFHLVSEFDDSKRSCRRRLAGHNERRRKSSHDSTSRNPTQDKFVTGRLPYLASPTGCALSLLSSKTDSWISPSDLSSRSSAALHELIAEHRATVLARQLILERHPATEVPGDSHLASHSILVPHQHQMSPEQHNWDRYHGSGAQVTLDLMQAPGSAFGLLSTRGKSKEEEEECSEIWNTLEAAHVV